MGAPLAWSSSVWTRLSPSGWEEGPAPGDRELDSASRETGQVTAGQKGGPGLPAARQSRGVPPWG